VHLFHGGSFEWSGLEVAGVVDQRVDAAELADGDVTEDQVGLFVVYVQQQRADVADAVVNGEVSVFADRRDDVPSCGGETSNAEVAEAASRAGDDDG